MSCGSGWSGGSSGIARGPGSARPPQHSQHSLQRQPSLSHGSGGQGEGREGLGVGYPKMNDIPSGSHCDPSAPFAQLPSPPMFSRAANGGSGDPGAYLLSNGVTIADTSQAHRSSPGDPRRYQVNGQPLSDMRLPSTQHSSFYRNGNDEDQKSESPSRKRQRLVRSPVGSGGLGHPLHHHGHPGGSHPHHMGHPQTHQRDQRRPTRHPPPPPPPPPPTYQPARISQPIPHQAVGGLGSGSSRTRQYYGGVGGGARGGMGAGGSRHRPTPHPPQYPRPSTSHQPPPVTVAHVDVSPTNLVQVPVTLSMPVYNVPPPAPTLPPCQMPNIIWASPPSHVPPPLELFRGTRGFGECPHHHHHHHHHGGGGGTHHGGGGPSLAGGSASHHNGGAALLHGEAAVAAAVAALRTTPPLHTFPPPPPPPPEFELEIIVDHPYHRRPPVLQVSAAPSSLASGILISEVGGARRPPPRARWPRTPLPTVTAHHPPTHVPAGLFHFLTMITSMNEALSPMYSQRELSHDPFGDTYEELLSLAERLGEGKPRGLTRAELDKLPSYIYEASTRGDQTSCVVCMCDFEVGHTLRKLHCCHMFHSKCVDKWLKANRTCPICRRDAAGNPPKIIFNTD